MSYIKLNGRTFDADVAISAYERNFNVVDGQNAGRTMSGLMTRDIIGTYIGHTLTVFRRGDNYAGVDDSVLLEAADGQTTISYQAYYTGGTQALDHVAGGVNYWGEISVNFIPIDAQKRPAS